MRCGCDHGIVVDHNGKLCQTHTDGLHGSESYQVVQERRLRRRLLTHARGLGSGLQHRPSPTSLAGGDEAPCAKALDQMQIESDHPVRLQRVELSGGFLCTREVAGHGVGKCNARETPPQRRQIVEFPIDSRAFSEDGGSLCELTAFDENPAVEQTEGRLELRVVTFQAGFVSEPRVPVGGE